VGVYVRNLVRAFLLVATIVQFGCAPAAPKVDALVYETAKPIKPFKFSDQHGEVIDNKALTGKWTLLFLGYTSCPDICPMTLSKLAQVKQQLTEHPQLTVWFVSVDPQRDTSEKLKLYTDYFDPSFTAVTGPHSELFPFVRNLGLVYAISDSKGENYTVDHSASVALVDPNGNVRAIFKPEFKAGSVPLIDADKMVAELNQIIAYY
jgi:protein SCO1/2